MHHSIRIYMRGIVASLTECKPKEQADLGLEKWEEMELKEDMVSLHLIILDMAIKISQLQSSNNSPGHMGILTNLVTSKMPLE